MAADDRLAVHGDPVDREAWSTFLESDFPSYQTYWLRSVVPLTKRPEPGGFRPKSELEAMGKTDHDVCLAQLHYTILGHLQAAFDLRQARPPLAVENFVHTLFVFRPPAMWHMNSSGASPILASTTHGQRTPGLMLGVHGGGNILSSTISTITATGCFMADCRWE